jgi:hypothetical protein
VRMLVIETENLSERGIQIRCFLYQIRQEEDHVVLGPIIPNAKQRFLGQEKFLHNPRPLELRTSKDGPNRSPDWTLVDREAEPGILIARHELEVNLLCWNAAGALVRGPSYLCFVLRRAR